MNFCNIRTQTRKLRLPLLKRKNALPTRVGLQRAYWQRSSMKHIMDLSSSKKCTESSRVTIEEGGSLRTNGYSFDGQIWMQQASLLAREIWLWPQVGRTSPLSTYFAT